MNLFQMVYVSDARPGTNATSLHLLLERCRPNNQKREITGLLLYSRSHFIQILEGPGQVLTDVFTKIACDPRHSNVEQLHFGPCEHRLFQTWRMGLLNLDALAPLDRNRLHALINPVRGNSSGKTILSLMNEFRSQLFADDGTAHSAA